MTVMPDERDPNTTIWKFPLPIEDFVLLDMPKGAKVLTVQTQQETVCLWAIVNPNNETEKRGFYIVGTGHPFPKHASDYVGTVQVRNGFLVFHVFEAISYTINRVASQMATSAN